MCQKQKYVYSQLFSGNSDATNSVIWKTHIIDLILQHEWHEPLILKVFWRARREGAFSFFFANVARMLPDFFGNKHITT